MKAIVIWFHVQNSQLFVHDEAQKVIVDRAAQMLKTMSKSQFFKEIITSSLLHGFK